MQADKRIIATIISASILMSLTTGCAESGPKQTGGAVIGGATGALVGSQFGHGEGRLIGAAIGGLLGAFAGGAIGQQMDARDRELAQRATQYALENSPDNASRAWHNPNNNHSGRLTVTGTKEYSDKNLVCRDYVHTVNIDGRTEDLHGRACRDVRDPRAAWMVQK